MSGQSASAVDRELAERRRRLYEFARSRAHEAAAALDARESLVVFACSHALISEHRARLRLSDADEREALLVMVNSYAIASGLSTLWAMRGKP